MALFVPARLSHGFNDVAFAAANVGGDQIQVESDHQVVLEVRNSNATLARTITIAAGQATLVLPGLGIVTKANLVLAVPGVSNRLVLLRPIGAWKSPTTGLVAITWSAVADMTFRCYRLMF
jgi:hypothetical protein